MCSTSPAKTNLQDHARILQESCMQDLLGTSVHAICPFSCMILAQSCTYLARNGARLCKSCCKNNYLHFLHIFCKILQELVQDCARKWTYHVHVPSKSCMQDSCTILQVRFCWEVCKPHTKLIGHEGKRLYRPTHPHTPMLQLLNLPLQSALT